MLLYAVLPIGGTEKYVKQGNRITVTFSKFEPLSLHKLPAKLVLDQEKVYHNGFVVINILSYKKLRDGYVFKKIRRHGYQRKLGIRKIIAEIEIKEIIKNDDGK